LVNVEKSRKLFESAQKLIPGGVNSETRGPRWEITPGVYPMFIDHAKGSHFWDVDGNEFIDYMLGYGPLILGHASQKVNEAVLEQLEKGTLLGLSHEIEQKVAEIIVEGVPCAEMVRFQNTGTDACTAAVRIARAYTGKEKIARLDMGYHGWHDWALVDVAGGLENNYIKAASVPGISASALQDIVVLPWNKIEVVEKIIKRHGHEIAAVMCEPIRPPILPKDGFFKALREITEDNDILLIFDEVKSGFRIAFGGAQEYLNVTPDLAIFSKSLGNGFPVAAVAGKRDVMLIVPEVSIAGTFNANGASMAAALATLSELKDPKAHKHLYEIGGAIKKGITDAVEDTGVEAIVAGPEPMFTIVFTQLEEITTFEDWKIVKKDQYKNRRNLFERELLEGGVFYHPGIGQLFFDSLTHTKEDAEKTVQAAYEALKKAKKVQS